MKKKTTNENNCSQANCKSCKLHHIVEDQKNAIAVYNLIIEELKKDKQFLIKEYDYQYERYKEERENYKKEIELYRKQLSTRTLDCERNSKPIQKTFPVVRSMFPKK